LSRESSCIIKFPPGQKYRQPPAIFRIIIISN
jgi:hypothetical protein